ncbi:MAG: sulfurtransferase TusA family protein [Promethearchaeota archaeon]
MTKTHILDCAGLVCPQPVATTKRMMNKMNSGDILEVSGDFIEAGENIKRFVEKHGGKILESKVNGENYYIKIEKE